jgi:hypothetical protein
MNNTIRIINTCGTDYATDIDQNLVSVGIKHQPYQMGRTDMNRILANTTKWKPKFKPEYHAKTT